MRSLHRVGVFPTRATPVADVIDLLAELHPQVAGAELVRLGPSGDGGYLIPDDLDGIEGCFSPGVSDVSGFEKECAERGIPVFMADGTVDRPGDEHPQFAFLRRNVGAINDASTMTIDRWVAESMPGSTGDLILQIDIEGCEYEVFLNISEALMRRFRYIVAEFHGLERLFSSPSFLLMSAAFHRLLQTHACVHIHPNNCGGSVTVGGIELPQFAEFTLARRDRVVAGRFATVFPHPLDADCTPEAHVPLSRDLYRSYGRSRPQPVGER
jgi:hypothetical protein